jgi:glutathione S-transferase
VTAAQHLPILYSFRRCPYAMRARYTLRYAAIPVELREVSLRAKPAEMLRASPKGTVPVLVIAEAGGGDTVLEESLDIMRWALARNDPDGWLARQSTDADDLITLNDSDFKYWLDRYKYPDRYDLKDVDMPLTHCIRFLSGLESRLLANRYLFGDRMTLADAAIFPFVRQFVFVDPDGFSRGQLPSVRRWLDVFLESATFGAVMQKNPFWGPGSAPLVFQ